MRLLILDGPPGDLLYTELSVFSENGFSITLNTHNIQGVERIDKYFHGKIKFVNFNLANRNEIINILTQDNLGYEVIKLRLSTKIDSEIISKATSKMLRHRLKIIVQSGVGVDHIDCNAATKNGVVVTHTPGSNANAVAEFVIGQILVLSRNLMFHASLCNQGVWSRQKEGLRYSELRGKILGIIGIGNIASQLIPKANALGMRVMGYHLISKIKKNKDLNLEILTNFNEFLQRADFISLHVPLNDTTKNLLSTKEFQSMKKGAFLINTARGGIIDEFALAEELKREDRNLAAAAIDVHVYEESAYTSPLIGLSNVLLTPHIAGTTPEALTNAVKLMSYNIIAIFNGQYNVPIANKEVLNNVVHQQACSL